MRRRFDISIVGAGVAGLTLAALLAKSRRAASMNVSLYDAGPRPTFRNQDDVALRVSAIANGSADILSRAGAWSAIAESRISPYERMRVWDEQQTPDSRAALRFDAAEYAASQLGFIIENVLLQDALLRVLDDADVTVNFDKAVSELPDADLIVGADGAASKIRERAGIETRSWSYRQAALVTHLYPEKPHERTALQRFLRTGPLGILPLADGRVSVVWSTTPERAESALAASDAELGQRLSEASDYALGELTIAGPRGRFPLAAVHAKNYVGEGIALLGDAAHAIHPLAGQGANLGLQDAAELASVIDSALDRGLHPGDLPVLRRYERARKGPNLSMLYLLTGLNRLFATDSMVLGEIRTAGMRLFNRSGPLKERAVKVALGIA